MLQKFQTLSLAAIITMAGAMGAFASTIDFTDNGSYTFTPALATGSTDGIGWSLDSAPAFSLLTNSEAYNGITVPVTPLALENDGIGVILNPNSSDDEVTFPTESLTMTFDEEVDVTGFYFLDLFGKETVGIYDQNNILLTTVISPWAAGNNSKGG